VEVARRADQQRNSDDGPLGDVVSESTDVTIRATGSPAPPQGRLKIENESVGVLDDLGHSDALRLVRGLSGEKRRFLESFVNGSYRVSVGQWRGYLPKNAQAYC
jgi:hypothetical protein